MKTEIERKYLVNSDIFKQDSHNKYEIVQGFLNKDKNRTVRVRLKDRQAYLTVKGISSENGLTRLEWESEIEYQEAEELLKLCEKPLLHKTRYEVIFKNKLFEVDEFHENHSGLVIAEIELGNEEETFEKPNWLGKEVTGDKRYYNSQL